MSYVLSENMTINMPKQCENPLIKELLGNFTFGMNWDINYCDDEKRITVGNYTKAERGDFDFVLNISTEGAYIEGKDYSTAMRGFITFLEKLTYSETDDNFYLEEECIRENPDLKFRAVHFCIFPETTLEFLKKCVRSCAFAKFNYVIFEFWGMFKFDCLKELSWPFAYSKEQIKEVVCEANALGMEIIPMFNHLGHAAACRGVNGKHVVLDQNPKLDYLFTSYGWIWNFNREDVYNLLRKVREELIEVCGEGSYFHIGCDEAYCIGDDEGKALETAQYINSLSDELKKMGRRAIMWPDMMYSRKEFEGYEANSTQKVSEILFENISRDILLADWQYDCHGEVWKTTEKLKNAGFDIVCCPWDKRENVEEAVKTITKNNALGIIETTWHTLFKSFRPMFYAGLLSYDLNEAEIYTARMYYCAHIVRMVMPSGGEYEKAGWVEKMTGPGL